MKIISRIVSIALSIGLLTSTTPALAAESLSGKGSSFAFSALSNCSASYTVDSPTYISTGSGTGRTEFANKFVDWAATDTPYTSGYPNFDYVTVPLFGGPVVFAYSAVGVGDGLQLTPEVISGILKGTITRWDDAEIKALNTRIKLPKKAIKVAYRASGSGTNSNLTNYLSQTVGGWLKGSNDMRVAAGSNFASNSTSFANSQLLATYIEDNSNAFGYFDLSDAITADVAIAKLKNAAGTFVAPTASAAAKFINSQTVNADGTVSLNFTKVVSGAYQLSILTYGLAPKRPASQKVSTGKGLAVQNWFKYIVSTCLPAKAATLGYVPLGGSLKTTALNIIKTIG
jgi:phosphate transport system substrate-binding protein